MPLHRRKLLGGVAALLPLPAFAQTEAPFPNRPIRVVVGFPPGQSIDILTRIVAEKLGPVLGQPVVVENRPGAGGRIGFEAVKRSPADGYTLASGSNGPLTIIPTLYPNDTPYAVERDFTPVATLARSPYVFLVKPDSPIRDVAGLRAADRAAPGTLTYGTPGVGTTQHLTAQMFATALGVTLQHVPYRGSPEALTDLIGGRLVLTVDSLPGALAAIRAGQVRPIAISSTSRSDILPNIPSMADAGLPAVQADGWFGILGPAGLPPRIAAQVHDAIGQVVGTPQMAAQLADSGLSGYVLAGPDFAQLMRDDTARFREVIRVSNIRID